MTGRKTWMRREEDDGNIMERLLMSGLRWRSALSNLFIQNDLSPDVIRDSSSAHNRACLIHTLPITITTDSEPGPSPQDRMADITDSATTHTIRRRERVKWMSLVFVWDQQETTSVQLNQQTSYVPWRVDNQTKPKPYSFLPSFLRFLSFLL